MQFWQYLQFMVLKVLYAILAISHRLRLIPFPKVLFLKVLYNENHSYNDNNVYRQFYRPIFRNAAFYGE